MTGGREGPAEEVARLASEALTLIANAADEAALRRVRQEVAGKSGLVSRLMALLAAAPRAEKPSIGQAVNRAKSEILAALEAREAAIGGTSASGGPSEDVTLPGRRLEPGCLHPLTVLEERVVSVLSALGFEATEGPEVEDEFHNFIALNIPPDHPARDEADNFYLEGVPHLLRSQTSTVQVRALETRTLPLRIIAPGRVFRPDEVDATHHFLFHQVEGLAVDADLSMADLKGTLLAFFRGLLGEEVQVRLRPSFFPFTEPSAEVDVRLEGRGWVEAGGCGMVDPAVFTAVGVDPERWSGFAFGLGLERLAMRHYGVADIRWFFENDLRFLRRLDGQRV
jgi:phenylalanyl-tRNA synthetase alpha chain